MSTTSYGYARVSSIDQNEARQILAFENVGIARENIFLDKLSGKNFDRPEYKRMVDKVGENDVIYIKSIDRLGRNYEEIQEEWRNITKTLKADIVVMDMPLLDTRLGKDLIGTFLADVILQVLSFVAENERNNIKARQREGIAAAKLKGVHLGRKKNPLPDNFEETVNLWKEKIISGVEAAERCGMSKSCFYYKAAEYIEEST